MSKPDAVPAKPKFSCTECGGDALVGYGNGWEGRVKKGERLCTRCFQKRGGENFFGGKRK